MEAFIVLGTLGTGRTKTVKTLLSRMTSEQLSGVYVIANGAGAFAVDIDRLLQSFGDKLKLTAITNSCMSCTNLSELIVALERLEKLGGLLLVDATGIAEGHELRAAFTRFDMPWHCLTLVNPYTFEVTSKAS